MESDQGGELGDIIRGTVGTMSTTTAAAAADWKFPTLPESISFPSPSTHEMSSGGCFGDPFSDSGRDPLLDELSVPNYTESSNGGFVKIGINRQVVNENIQGFLQFSTTSGSATSPAVLTRGLIRPPPPPPPQIAVDGHVMKMMNNNSISSFLSADHNNLRISSPTRTPVGIKRRKSQAKKVVCIPAPAAAGSRQSGEVVPSDLWAWRKYGQKPIKGSPYPRGYYRCSSSKGCSARKQVERSRNDPNMLVITYTSEHNHPWPTQRNVLAGSTRAQPVKTSTSASKNSSGQDQKSTDHQTKEMAIIDCCTAEAKEEDEEETVDMEMINAQALDSDLDQDVIFPKTYKPMFDELLFNSNYVFDHLGGFDQDPMDLLYISKGLLDDQKEQGERQNGSKGVDDTFSLFDWATNTIEESKDVGLE